jgi:tRNA-2-methylthio-N6-dimethylallyladenosine synthase
MPNYHIWTIGCQMNKAESERLGALLEQRSYQAIATPEKADLVILNTCVVRDSAENRVVNKLHILRRLKKQRPEMTIAVTGCFVDADEAALRKKYPQVDYFFKAGDLPQWLDHIQAAEILPQHPPVSVYIPIMQGCNNFCSYCIVPFRRGRERSRPVAEIVNEVRLMAARGAKEIILVGQNVDSYGRDLPDTPDLADLLDELNGLDDVLRLRFLTSHPKDMSRKLIQRIASLDKVCAHINLPVQAGDDAILELMKRGYAVSHYRDLVREIRREIPDVALSTDIIVGFPSESERQFQNTVGLLRELKLDAVHVACYSPRAGTYAARHLPDDVPANEKDRRLKIIEDLQKEIITEINQRLLGQTVEVLVENKTKGKWRGRTRSDKLVFFSVPGDYTGRQVNIRIEKTGPWSLQGSVERESGKMPPGGNKEER